jgi:hypothetical protein
MVSFGSRYGKPRSWPPLIIDCFVDHFSTALKSAKARSKLAPGLELRQFSANTCMHNFVGLPADQLLERMVELSLRTEEHL